MKKIRKDLCIVLVVCLALTMALSACGSKSGDSGDAKTEGGGTVKIGCVFPLSGTNALLGGESLRGAELAVDELNANGGLWGNQVELVIADAPDVTAGQTETERLITKDQLPLIFGSYSSGLANVNSDVAARYDIPFFELGGIGSDVMEKGYEYLWRTCCDAIAFGTTQADFYEQACREELGVKKEDAKITITHEDSLFGTSVAEAAEKQFEKLGYTKANIKVLPYSAASVDLSTVILDSKAYNPDVFLAISYVNDAILLGRQAKELNFQPPVWIGGGAGWAMKDTQDGIGKDIYGIYDVDWPQYAMNRDNVQGLDEYIQLYKDKFGEEPRSGHSLGDYVGAQMMFKVLQNAGSFDKDAIKEAASKIDDPIGTYTGGWGCKFDERGQNIQAPAVMFMWGKDALEAVWPENFAVTDLVLPMPTWAEKAAL